MPDGLLIGVVLGLTACAAVALIIALRRHAAAAPDTLPLPGTLMTRVVCPDTSSPTVVWLDVTEWIPTPRMNVVRCERFASGEPTCDRRCVALVEACPP